MANLMGISRDTLRHYEKTRSAHRKKSRQRLPLLYRS
ncbi:MAG: hypothetical protein ACLTBC_03695 [Pilosibacter sp.]